MMSATATKALADGAARPGCITASDTGYLHLVRARAGNCRFDGEVERGAHHWSVSVADVPLRAARPQFAALANDKLSRIVKMPTWRDALRRYLAKDERLQSAI